MIDKNLLKLLGKDKKYIFIVVACSYLSFLSDILFSLCLCYILHLALNGVSDFQSYLYVSLLAIGAMLLHFVGDKLKGNFAAMLGNRSKKILREKIFDKMVRLGSRSSSSLNLASLTQVSVEGVEQLDLYYSVYLPQFFFAVSSPFVLFILFMFINQWSAIILICCVPLIPMSIIMVSKYAKKIFATYWDEYTRMGDSFLDNISGLNTLKIYDADEAREKEMAESAESFRKITMKVLTMQLASTTIMDLVSYAGAAGGIAIALATQGNAGFISNMEIPVLVLAIVLLAVNFFLPLRALGSAFHVSMNGATAGKKIMALLETPEPSFGQEKIEGEDIRVNNLSFSYPSSSKKALTGVDLFIPKGSFVGIVGESGSGKSTLLALLSGFLGGYEGEIAYGDKKLSDVSRDSLYAKIGLMSYDSYLFKGSVKDNFLLHNPNISEEKMKEYLKQADIYSLVKDRGELDMEINEDSSNLSGGEKQRLALAMALSEEKDIYFFDEATSSIDKDSEESILNSIIRLTPNKSVIFVSHKLSLLEKADNIYVLEGGQVKGKGRHEELLASNKAYSRLYKMQKNLESGWEEAK